jgi:itaconate CoA-transferase
MPRVFGQSQILHVSELAVIVENNVPLIKAGAAHIAQQTGTASATVVRAVKTGMILRRGLAV